MKKTQIKDALVNILKQKVSFLSIIVIAFLGVTIFLGIDFSARGLKNNASAFYNSDNYRDIEIISTMLLSEDDLSIFLQTEGVADCEAVYQVKANAIYGDEKKSVNVVSLTERVNIPLLIEGRLPQTPNECTIDETIVKDEGWKIGDTIRLVDSAGESVNYLNVDEFVICGIANHPDNANLNVPKQYCILVTADAFNHEALGGCFMKAEIVIVKPDGIDRFSKEYESLVGAVVQRIEGFTDSRTAARDEQVHSAYMKIIDENRAQLDEGRIALESARQELDEGQSALADGERELEEGRVRLDDSQTELENAWNRLEDARIQLESARSQLDRSRAELNRSWNELQSGRARLDSARDQLQSTWNQMEDAKSDIRNKIKTTLDDLCNHDTSEVINWASRSSVNVDSSSATSTDFWITDNYKIDINVSVEDRVDAFCHSSAIPQRIVVWVYEKMQIDAGTDPDNIPEPTEADLDAARSHIAQKVDDAIQPLIDRYNDMVSPYLQWNSGHAEYIDGLSTYNDGLRRYNSGRSQYDSGEARYRSGLAEYESGLAEYNAGKAEYEQGLSEYEAGLVTIENKRQELEDGEARYSEGLEEFNNGQAAIDEALDDLAKIARCRWVIFDCKGNVSFIQASVASENLAKLKLTFALLFILVGALVIYATVSKMIDEQRTQIGTVKALGFFKREIFGKYLIYGVTGTMLGVVLGILTARFGLEPFVLKSYNIYYIYDMTDPVTVWSTTSIVSIAGVILAVAAIWIASTLVLQAPAMELLKPKIPNATKRKQSSSTALPLYTRLILLNMAADIKRIIVTIVSVGGCCSLLVIGFTLKHAVDGCVEKQFNEIVKYDVAVKFDPEIAGSGDVIASYLESSGAECVELFEDNIAYKITKNQAAKLLCGDIERISSMYSLMDWKSGEPVTPSDEGIYIQRRIAEIYDLDTGDEFEIAVGGTDIAKVKVAGVFENYFGYAMIMSDTYYEELYNSKRMPNTFYVRLNGVDPQKVADDLKKIDGFVDLVNSDEDKAVFRSSTSVINTIIILFILMAGIMAGVVLLNLTNIYVMQKMREITVMRINGFTTGETIGYILRETVITTIAGIILGISMGSGIAYGIVRAMEQAFFRFDRSISYIGWILGIVITLFFTVIVNLIALRKVRNIKLTDMT